jgi:hypothetical protein
MSRTIVIHSNVWGSSIEMVLGITLTPPMDIMIGMDKMTTIFSKVASVMTGRYLPLIKAGRDSSSSSINARGTL